jgi:TrmH family RNA methyltransferase
MNGDSIYSAKLPNKGIIVMGNEGNGISKEIEKLITHKIAIPKIGSGESLNVAVTTGIVLSEFTKKIDK